jgi:hypothetical protein
MSESFQPTIDSILSGSPQGPPNLGHFHAQLRGSRPDSSNSPSQSPNSFRSPANTPLRSALNTSSAPPTSESIREPTEVPEKKEYHPPGNSRLEPQIPEIPTTRQPSVYQHDTTHSRVNNQTANTAATQNSTSRSEIPLGRPANIRTNMPASKPTSTQASPHLPRQPSKLSSPMKETESDIITQLDNPKLKPGEMIVPLSLPTRVLEQYYSTITEYQRATTNLVTMITPDEESVKDAEEMLLRLDRIATHVDLDDPTTEAYEELNPVDEANWASQVSNKFSFLEHLIKELSGKKEGIEKPLSIAVVAEGGKLLDIVTRFVMVRIGAKYVRLDNGNNNIDQPDSEENLTIYILPSGNFQPKVDIKAVDAIIGMDSTLDYYAPSISQLRRHPDARVIVPIIYPIVYCSIEHIRLCAPLLKHHLDKVRVFTQCAIQTRNSIGELEPEEFKEKAAAEEVAFFIKSKCNPSYWTLMTLKPIKLEGLELFLANNDTNTSTPAADTLNRRKRQFVSSSFRPCIFAVH